ncbi:MarR family transcriptional regulator [Tenacibaculum sp. 190524A02b]|uniref:MarR family winged helix-turn-helix transcriptional regulator n=1 Tax=Tenacibaculum vairaonense TaxID=3137860 RepID=UPI0031FAF22E
MDFLKTLKTAGYTARIKRISDGIMHDSRKIYKEIDLDIEPNWHLVFLLLKERDKMTVTEISEALGFSHPAVIKIIKKMKLRGYLYSEVDKKDSRKQQISLSKKALNKLPDFEEEWKKMVVVLNTIFDKEIATLLDKLEDKLQERGLFESYKNYIQ